MEGNKLYGIPVEFIVFIATIIGIACFSSKKNQIVIGGLIILIAFKFLIDSPFHNFNCELYIQLINLFGLITGFKIMANHFEDSGFPELIPNYLPKGWAGPFVLLICIGFLSTFLDNIAAAFIGATISKKVFDNKVHIGYIAAIVAASNAGGAFSVIGDTTTTMIWIAGIPWDHVLRAFIASAVAILFCSFFAAKQQQTFQKIIHVKAQLKINSKQIFYVTLIIIGAIVANSTIDFPAIGVWVVIISAPFLFNIKRNSKDIIQSAKDSCFLLLLVFAASLLPLDYLTKLINGPCLTSLVPDEIDKMKIIIFLTGIISSVLDNIPLTKIAIDMKALQVFDYAFVAYAVGFGGSMMWFGSSAGVAITGKKGFPEAQSAKAWIKNSWFIPIAYILGFIAMCYFVDYDNKPKIKEKKTENFFCKFINGNSMNH